MDGNAGNGMVNHNKSYRLVAIYFPKRWVSTYRYTLLYIRWKIGHSNVYIKFIVIIENWYTLKKIS